MLLNLWVWVQKALRFWTVFYVQSIQWHSCFQKMVDIKCRYSFFYKKPSVRTVSESSVWKVFTPCAPTCTVLCNINNIIALPWTQLYTKVHPGYEGTQKRIVNCQLFLAITIRSILHREWYCTPGVCWKIAMEDGELVGSLQNSTRLVTNLEKGLMLTRGWSTPTHVITYTYWSKPWALH